MQKVKLYIIIHVLHKIALGF